MAKKRALTSSTMVFMAPLLLVAGAAATGCGNADTSSTGGSGGTTATGGSGGTGGATAEAQGCSADVKLLATSADSAERGPWPVGAKTVKIDTLTAEVWYPAEVGSDAGKSHVTYDMRDWLPASEMGKIPDAAAPVQDCGCYRDLPMDAKHGPYPVVVFIHGTAGFRTQSLAHMEHWASRGFVVVAADYPGLYLGDALNLNLSNDLPGDTNKILAALGAPAGDIAFLKDRIDMTHAGLSGHSAGGAAVKGFGSTPGVRVLIPMAAGGTDPSPTLESTLILGGVNDKVVKYDNQLQGFTDSAPRKRLVGLSNTGHLFPTDLCWVTNKDGQNIVETAQMYGIKNANLAGGLFDCPTGQLERDKARAIVNYATTAALEEKLTCKAGNPFDGIQAKYPDIADFKEELK
jgi:hypothetical protein